MHNLALSEVVSCTNFSYTSFLHRTGNRNLQARAGSVSVFGIFSQYRYFRISQKNNSQSNYRESKPRSEMPTARYFSIFIIPTSLSLSVYENIAISVWYWYYRPTDIARM